MTGLLNSIARYGLYYPSSVVQVMTGSQSASYLQISMCQSS